MAAMQLSQNHRMAWVGRDLKDHETSNPHHRQGHQPLHLILDQAAQGSIQPGLEHLQGWGIHSLSGQLFQHLTTLIVKNFPLTSKLNLSLLQLKTTSPCPAVIYPFKELTPLLFVGSL